jgi:hypothetical protein
MPRLPTLGPIGRAHPFSGPEACLDAAIRVVRRAERLVTLVTPDLEDPVYSDASFIAAIKGFLLAPRYTRVRILLTGRPTGAIADHPLIALSRRLSTSFDVRRVPRERVGMRASFIVADAAATCVRLEARRLEGQVALDNAPAARTHLAVHARFWRDIPPTRLAAAEL